MSMLETRAWIDVDGVQSLNDVCVIFEADGYEAIGLWVEDEHGNDVTEQIDQDEYERLNELASAHLLESMTEAAEMMEDR